MKLRKHNTIFIFTVLMLLISFYTGYSQEQNNDVFIRNGPRDEKMIALTFDDGPHPKETLEILDVLDKYKVKATFFVVGKHCNWYREPLIRAAKEGHEIGNHTFNHPDISNLSSNEIKKELKMCEETIVKLTGKKPTLFRPPFGSYNQNELGKIAKESGYKIVLWNIVEA